VIFDPIRRYTQNVDSGPDKVRNVTGFLRKLCVETGATILVVHHDVKSNGFDMRRRSNRASGGDWFAACECPIAFESVEGEQHTTKVIPEDYKFSSDPDPFTFRLETDSPKNPNWMKLKLVDPEENKAKAVQQVKVKILSYLKAHADCSGNEIRQGVNVRRKSVTSALEELAKENKITEKEGKWSIAEARA